jgi:hypothetical protein
MHAVGEAVPLDVLFSRTGLLQLKALHSGGSTLTWHQRPRSFTQRNTYRATRGAWNTAQVKIDIHKNKLREQYMVVYRSVQALTLHLAHHTPQQYIQATTVPNCLQGLQAAWLYKLSTPRQQPGGN